MNCIKMFNPLRLSNFRFVTSKVFSNPLQYTLKHGFISSIIENINNETLVSVKGWVRSLRVLKDRVFADINDGSTSKRLQVVIPKTIKPSNLSYGCSVEISGNLVTNLKGQIELNAENVKVIGECIISDGYPFNPRTIHPPEYIRQYLHLRPRTNYISAVLRLRSAVTMYVYDFFQKNKFLNVHTPILTSNDCEGAGEVFRVQPENEQTLKEMLKQGQCPEAAYFGNKTFLTVSGQLHLEAICRSIGNVYTLGPTFRAENSRSRLHLSEFYMLEAELAFCKSLEELQNFISNLIRDIILKLHESNSSDLEIVNKDKRIESWIHKDLVTLSYTDAIGILTKKGFNLNAVEGLNKEHELALVKHCDDVPVFVTKWPRELKSFYMKECEEDTTKVEALDLLLPLTGEVIGGSLREDNYEKLKAKIPSEQLQWYLDLRKFGNIPTGGFGMGLERSLQAICGISNIKDTIAFPRWPHNCDM